MSFNKYSFILVILILFGSISHAQVPQRAGWWKFDLPLNLQKAEPGFGLDLTLSGTQTAAVGPETGNGAVMIGTGSYYKMQHSIVPNGGGAKVNNYTLQYDFKIPATNVWHSFFQTTVNNSDDGDLFINPTGNIGVGAVGYSGYSVLPNEWYRLIVSVKNGSSFNCYLDGNLLMTGSAQPIDGRFSLSSLLLIFADNDGEDAPIVCSELAIWNQALTAAQALELGGFGHDVRPKLMTRIPYLQGAGQNTMNVCWHDTASLGTKVEYGLDSTALNLVTAGTSEIISDPYRWHTVKLTGLQTNTRYFYRVASGKGTSGVYSFKTLPDVAYTGKMRFVILSDTHASDTTMAGKVLRAARDKIATLYGPDIENHVNGIFHSGDITVSGNVPAEYSTEYFQPLAALSSNLPTMVVAGNHEGESPYFYKYLKLEDQSAYPAGNALNEKIWQMRVGNSLFIGLNTNIIDQYGTLEANWLNTKLKETENDASIDFVFLFMHHPPFSELWFDVSTFDGGANYVKNVLFPIIKKYTKVQQLHSGHTHGFERGTVLSGKPDGDFRYIIGGGGGGPLDSWGAFTNKDYSDTHIAYDQYCFQILEIDNSSHSWEDSMYSLGDLNKSRNSELMDRWHKKLNQAGPATPHVDLSAVGNDVIQFASSVFSGTDSLMSIHFQVADMTDFSTTIVDSLVHWKDIYGVDKNFNPIDRNLNINLYRQEIRTTVLEDNHVYLFHLRYRDHNLKWSIWSDPVPFTTKGIVGKSGSLNDSSEDYSLDQNYPNPFSRQTTIAYTIPEKSEVIIRIFDQNSRIMDEINEGIKLKGTYRINYLAENLSSGIYFYQLIIAKSLITRKMIKIEGGE
jgi:hypothetical protein